jgi:hypothetical protein
VEEMKGYIIDGNLMVLNPNHPIHITGNGKYNDDDLTLVYKDDHVFEISFDPKLMSVILAAERTTITERNHAPINALVKYTTEELISELIVRGGFAKQLISQSGNKRTYLINGRYTEVDEE